MILLFAVSFTISYAFQTAAQENAQALSASVTPLEISSDNEAEEEFDVSKLTRQDEVPPGTIIDEFNGIPVYSNGANYTQDHGLNFSESGYYFGYKWQCVEFVRRDYYVVFGHEMPDGAGHAKYFFDPALAQGQYNKQRGLYQYKNGGDVKPAVHDLVVFDYGAYGHVAIVSAVGDDWVEVIQQNSEYPRERYTLEVKDGNYYMRGERTPVGWLRHSDRLNLKE